MLATLSVQVKIPVTKIGLQAASKLTKSGIRVTMTGVYSVHQVSMFVEEIVSSRLLTVWSLDFSTIFIWSFYTFILHVALAKSNFSGSWFEFSYREFEFC